MPRALRFPKALVRHSIAARINILSRQTLPLVPLNNINKPSVYSATAFSHQSRGVHVLKDHELKFGREKYPQTYADGFQVGLDRLLAILRTPSLGNNLRHLILYGSANVHFNSNSDSPSDHGISSEDIDRLKQAIERAGFEDPQERESILSSIARNPADFKSDTSTEALKFKDALVTLLVAAAPNLESISMHPQGSTWLDNMDSLRSSNFVNYGNIDLLERLLRRASRFPNLVPYCHNLQNFNFHPDDYYDVYNEYMEQGHYHRLDMVRKLPAVESVAFKLATWSNEAGVPPPPRSANYSKISFTHSAMSTWDLCRVIESAKTLKNFTKTMGGRCFPEGGIPVGNVTPIFKSLWIHRQNLEELNLDMEGHTLPKELYGKEIQPDDDEEVTEDEQKEYEELWGDELQQLAAPEIPPTCISLKDFPQLKHLSIGAHTLCYLARGTGDRKTRIDSKSFNLVDHIPSTLESLRIYGYGQAFIPEATQLLDYEYDLDVDAQIEQLALEKDAKLPGLKILEGVDPRIPNGFTVEEWEAENNPELFWQDPDDNRWEDLDDA